MKNPLVSVIIPTYNTQEYIKNILSSIVEQTYKNIELIIINDGSTDDTERIAKNFLKDTDLDWSIINTNNKGVANARNIGIEKAKGDWIIMPDSDDYLLPAAIEKLVTTALGMDTDVVFCQFKRVTNDQIKSGNTFDKGCIEFTQNELKKMFFYQKKNFAIPATLIRHSILKDLKFDRSCLHSEDVLFTWELIYKIKKAVCIDSDFYNYLTREGSKQHSLNVKATQQSICEFEKMVDRLKHHYNYDKYMDMICPNFIVSSHRIMATCNVDYNTFFHSYKLYRMKVTYRYIFMNQDIKRFLYMLIFRISPSLFYNLGKKIRK